MWDSNLFMDRIRVFRMEDADILELDGQFDIQEYWSEKFKSLNNRSQNLGSQVVDKKQFERLKRIAQIKDQSGAMLAAIIDKFFPGDFEKFVQYAFEEGIDQEES